MKRENNKIYGILERSIILSILFCSIIFSANAAKAADNTYYWTPSAGAIGSSGYTANWGNCNAQPISYRITTLGSTGFTCNSDRLTTTSSGDQFLAIYPTAYSSDTQIKGKTGATFYLSSQRSGYTATYRFDLGYASGGSFTSLGYVTRSVSSQSGQSYTIDMSSISGTAPAGSYPALRVSVTTSRGGRVYLGTNGGSTGSNSGRFYVNETVTQPPAPAYNVTIRESQTSANIIVGSSYTYDITVNNTGNTNGNYTLNLSDSDNVNFTGSTLGTTDMQINGGGSSTTTLTVTSKVEAADGAVDITNVTVLSVENPVYTDSTSVQTTTKLPGNDPKIIVNTDRYSLFAPWTGKASDTSLSANFTAYALLLDSDGNPVPGQSITFKIYSGGGTILKATRTATTQQNGLAGVSYDTYSDFTGSGDTDYGIWKIDAFLTDDLAVISSTDMRIEAGGNSISGCGQNNCHKTNTVSGARPRSPYTAGYGSTLSRAVAAHEKSDHNIGCYYCHAGYAATKTGNGYTGDVHRNRSCDYCHGTWSYTSGSGNGIPKMPSCYDCHPVFNNNPSIISTLDNLLGGNNNISVYSFNYDLKKPLAVHTGINYSLVDSVPCLVCHGPAHNNSKPYNAVSSSNNVTENEQCWTCHTNRATTHKLSTNCVGCHTQNAHNISIAGGGGPDCILCHGSGGSATHTVDATAMVTGEHSNLNSGATANGVSADNKKCWGCHQTGGTQPEDMGDRYNNPYKCYDCHNATKPYTNVSIALTVSQHFNNGTNIKAAMSASDNSASCISCHNITEMKVSYTESDGINTEYSLASHYGKNRSDLRNGGSTDCEYCHQNTSTIFSIAMNNTANNNMSNHSILPATPLCITCHGPGKIHDASLSIPASSSDAYCKTCHATKNEHKALNCTECHANNSAGNSSGRDIHGIKYLQKNNTFSTNKTNAVDCTTCHQSSLVDSSIGMTPVKISNQSYHSDDILNGSKWDNYWNSSINSCLYCHNDTIHSLTPLGRPLVWNSSYVINSVIGSGTNCADCHYNGDADYANMQNAYTSSGLSIPPEITSGSWNGKPGYYNHTLTDYTDSQCKSCHDKSGITTVGQMMHSTFTGSAGSPDCKLCHDAGGSAPKLINFSAANNSAHKNLNTGASSTVDAEDKKCWACHGDGTQPVSGHPSNYKTPAQCENCHTGTGGYGAPLVKEHIQNATYVQTSAACSTCHNNSGMFMDSGGIGTVTHYIKNVTDTTTTPYGHSGTIDTANCLICHKGQYTGNATWGSPVNITTSLKRKHTETTNTQCDGCHKDDAISTLANVDFHNASVSNFGGNCLDCHANAE